MTRFLGTVLAHYGTKHPKTVINDMRANPTVRAIEDLFKE
jgi:hypothetical protein